MSLLAHSPPVRIVVEDYYEDEEAATAHASGSSSSSSSSPLLLSVSGSELVSELVLRYRVHTQRHALRDPIVFLAHPAQCHHAAAAHADPIAATPSRPAAADTGAARAGAAVPAIPLSSSSSSSAAESAASLLVRVRGKRVQLSPRDVASCTLRQLCVRDGSVLTVRSRPFPLRVLVDNTALVRAGVPSTQLDRHAIVVWAEERTSVRQLRDEYVRQARENPSLLGCDRHRFFVRPARAPLHDGDQKDEQEAEEEDTTHGAADASAAAPSVSVPSDALEITLLDSRLLQSLPLRAGSVVWVQKDPSRWLSDAVRAGDEQRAQKLIDLGADAHLLDAQGHSAFFYAQQIASQRAAKAAEAGASSSGDVQVHNSMQLLLQRNFPPSPLESHSFRVLLSSYADWLATGACVQKHTVQWLRKEDVREYDDYAFVHSGVDDPAEQLRPVTNERHKLVGYVNLRRGITGGTIVEPQGNAVAPLDIQTVQNDGDRPITHESGVQLAALPSSSSSSSRPATAAASGSPPSPCRSGGPGPGASAKGMWPSYNRAPETLLFDVAVTQPDRVGPVTVFLRSPQFPTPTASNPTVNALRRVTPFRSLVTRFDVFKNAYMMNLKLAALVVSAASALYAFAFSAAGSGTIAQQYWIQGELRAIFALTMLKAAAAALFMLRTALPQRTLHFPRIKSHLLLTGHEWYAAECWFYFLLLEAADAGMIVCNVRILSSLLAGVGGHVSLYPSDLHPGAPPLSEAQSLLLSILVSLLSLVSLNLLDTLISFLADETPRMSAKVRRYLMLHLPVLIQCFAALRLCFDLREMRLSSASGAGADPADPSSSSSFSHPIVDATTGFLSYLTPTTLAFLFAYLCGLSLKNLQVLFHPPMNHALADEELGAAAMDTDSKASIVYVVLACVVYGAAQNPASDDDRQMIREREEGILFPLALGFYFASAIVLAATALLPFMLRAMDKQVQWAPPMLSKAAEQLAQRLRSCTVSRRRVASRSPSLVADEAELELLQAPTDAAHPHAA